MGRPGNLLEHLPEFVRRAGAGQVAIPTALQLFFPRFVKRAGGFADKADKRIVFHEVTSRIQPR